VLARDQISEVRVGHVQEDAIAGAQRVDVAEGRKPGGAVPGDRGRAGDAGQVRFGIDPRPLLQFRGAGAHDDDVGDVQAGDVDAPDRAAARGVALQLAREKRDPLALSRERGQPMALKRRGRSSFDVLQGPIQLVLLQAGIERGERLLPDERDSRVDQHEHAEHDQRPGQHPPGAAHQRRRADSVPPSDPGPA
jgi:hypothetical protein